ncbi:hypothetical protein I7I53_11710 [Histoplasma capsulatum var. duboisii H88]|uniref:Uncharacterized protein n=1 Tax=Ajellomyces capsulatus (strain H88) TaxID=544711 RepID=A0A8A1LUP7_AJEC8|nr:hypothetical protein I7I53_11710 [Histoplasma capsulatum var. duboisii H88]
MEPNYFSPVVARGFPSGNKERGREQDTERTKEKEKKRKVKKRKKPHDSGTLDSGSSPSNFLIFWGGSFWFGLFYLTN